MPLPKIDLLSLPDLKNLTGAYASSRRPGHDDTIVVIATFIYQRTPHLAAS